MNITANNDTSIISIAADNTNDAGIVVAGLEGGGSRRQSVMWHDAHLLFNVCTYFGHVTFAQIRGTQDPVLGSRILSRVFGYPVRITSA